MGFGFVLGKDGKKFQTRKGDAFPLAIFMIMLINF